MNELLKKLGDYRVALEAEKHLAEPANEVQASNNVRIRSEAAEARRQLRDAVRRAAELWRRSMIATRQSVKTR